MTTSNEWDDYADGWDGDEGARAYASAAFTSLEPLLVDAGVALVDARVIDFGCGTGLLTEPLVAAGAAVDAVDTSANMLEVVTAKIAERSWSNVSVSTVLPDEYEAFDLVVCSSVCAFVDDYSAAVAELAARLRPGGLFVQWDWERTDADDHGLTRTEIDEALTRAGLIDVVVDTAFTVTVGEQTMSPIVGHGRRSVDRS